VSGGITGVRPTCVYNNAHTSVVSQFTFFGLCKRKKAKKKRQSHKFNSPRPFSRKATLSANHSIRNLYVNSRDFDRFVPN